MLILSLLGYHGSNEESLSHVGSQSLPRDGPNNLKNLGRSWVLLPNTDTTPAWRQAVLCHNLGKLLLFSEEQVVL